MMNSRPTASNKLVSIFCAVAIFALVVPCFLAVSGCRQKFSTEFDTVVVHDHDTTNICACNWTVSSTGTSETIIALSAPDSNNLFVCGSSGLVQRSTNGGASWTTMTAPTSATLYACFFNTPLDGWVAGGDGNNSDTHAYHTTDGGASWQAINVDANYWVRRMYFPNPMKGYFALSVSEQSGEIMETQDGGATFTKRYTSNAGLYGLAFTDANNGVCTGRDGTGLWTSDGGTTWTRSTTTMIDDLADDAAFVPNNPMLGFAANYTDASTGAVSRTTDGGHTWSTATQVNFGVYPVAVNNRVVVAGGDNGNVLVSTDLGTTWASSVIGRQKMYSAKFVNSSKCVVVGVNGFFATNRY